MITAAYKTESNGHAILPRKAGDVHYWNMEQRPQGVKDL